MNEILVAVDGSKHSLKVVDFAASLAKDLSSEILLVYVMNMPPNEPESIAAFEKAEQYPDAYAEYLQAISEETTRSLTDRLAKSGIKCRTIVPSGNVASEILEISENEKNVFMIVVGMRGLHGIERIRSLGSVARRIIENSSKPVVVVP